MATITNHLKLDWRIDVEAPGYLETGIRGAQPGLDVRSLASRENWSSYFVPTTSKVPDEAFAPVEGAFVNPTIQINAYGAQPLCRHFLGDHHFRIWIVPPVLIITNPVLGLPYTFHIWNAFPSGTNSLNTVGGSGQTGLTLNFTPPVVYGEVEFKAVTITMDDTAPIEVHAFYTFIFADGVGDFEFITSLARFLDIIPEPPVIETWEFFTDVMRSWDATEKRVQLRADPRIGQQFNLTLEDDDDYRKQYNQWYKSMPADIVIAYAAYSTELTAAVSIGATKLFFDPARSDFRDDDFLVLLDPATETGELATISTVDADGATLNAGVTQNHTTRTLVCPGHRSRLGQPGGPVMRPITGELRVNSVALNPRSPLSRPGSTAIINTFDGFDVLDRRPLAERDVADMFDAGYEIIDGKVGAQAVKTAWPHPFVSGSRVYLIQRFLDPNEMDYWRDFIDAAKGQQNPFLAPTFRDDLTKATDPIGGSLNLDITNSDYQAQYFPHETYKRIQIMTTGAGVLWRKVNSVLDNGDGTWQLSLDTVIPVGFGSIAQISFMVLARLGSDKVKLIHGHIASQIDLLIRAIDA